MPIPVEQFTAPGKYYYDLSMELLEVELNVPTFLYNNLSNKHYNTKKEIKYNSYKLREN